MKRNNSSIKPEQEHLPLSVLRRYQEGVLPASEEHRVEKHVLACALCADILAGMALQSNEQTAAAVQEINRRVSASLKRPKGKLMLRFSRRNLAVAATILLLICSAGLVFFYNLEKVKQKKESPFATTSSGPAQSQPPVLRPATPEASPAPAAPPKAADQLALAKPVPGRQQSQPAPATSAAVPDDAAAEVAPAEVAARETAPDSLLVTPPAIAAAPPAVLSGRIARVATNTRVKSEAAGAEHRLSVPAVDVSLETDSQALSEVTVVPYGKEDITAGTEVATNASPAGGWSSFKKYVKANLKHPTEAGEKKVSGSVEVGFTVNSDGSLADVRVIKSLSPATDAEALRLVQQGPRWQPAKAGNKAVPQEIRVSIRFRGKA